MLFKKDELSKFHFLSIPEFIFVLFLIFLSSIFSLLALPIALKKFFPYFAPIIDTRYFDIMLFYFSILLSIYVIYFFCCKKKHKTLKEGLFLNPKSKKVYFISILIGIIMPLITLPIIFKFAPKEFYAMDLAKTKDGLIFLMSCAIVAPIYEEIIYRGLIFSFIQSKANSFWAVIITAVLFGLSHLMNIGNAHILISLFIFYGFVLTLIRYCTRSLIPPIITHFVHNLTLIASFLILSNA